MVDAKGEMDTAEGANDDERASEVHGQPKRQYEK